MDAVSKLVSGVLLLADAVRDNDSAALETAHRWIQPTTPLRGKSAEEELFLSQQIVFGDRPAWTGEPEKQSTW